MEFFNKVGNSMREMMKPAQAKVQNSIQIGKLNTEIRKKEDELQKKYTALGRECYQSLRANCDASEVLMGFMLQIDDILAAKKKLEEEKNILCGERLCPSCGTFQPRTAKFCPECGASMPIDEKPEEPDAPEDEDDEGVFYAKAVTWDEEEAETAEVTETAEATEATEASEDDERSWEDIKTLNEETQKILHQDSPEASEDDSENRE